MFTCTHCLSDTENESDICDGCVEKANEENCVHRLQCRDIERDLVESQAAMHRMYAEIMRLRAALREAYEVYAGSDGFIPETASEGYQQQVIKQMVNCISAALEGK